MTQIIVIEKDQLQQLIRDEIRSALSSIEPSKPQEDDTLLAPKQVAEIIGYAPSTFGRAWRRLHHESGFPRPVVGDGGKGSRWSKKAIMKWVERRG